MKLRWKFIIIAIILLLGFIYSVSTGQSSLSLQELWQTVLGNGTPRQELVLFQFRIPRMILGFLVGGALAIAGMLLQAISRNALADPGILGINAGAGLSMMLFLLLQNSSTGLHTYVQPLYALLGGFIVVALLFLLPYDRNQGIIPIRLIYTGIAVAAAISAFMIVLTFVLDPSQYQMIKVWLAGNIGNSNWSHVYAMLPWLLIIVPLLIRSHLILDVLRLNDPVVISLGVSLNKYRVWFLVCSVLLAAPAVAVSGSIGFVGLVVPHLVRRLFRGHKIMIPACLLIGGGLVVIADALGKMVVANTEIPAGVIVALIGAPYFLYLLIKSE
ncbi:FecCD family ABC transporter permease [Paenibacillus odorifer]|uniref:FecCD family ABC transporter permease n=1 Tax=Paenibacillus odorifer TaxID=189426 RepID=UPI002DB99C3E|nr:iron ABC transporter permease [Paenibacillus odorifer]MEC0134367.1 iron ABC transporter permease [Paenibacillus odorifer]MEC0222907.1 iron ABC transporter permease [Paenibacillus odorifer]